MSIFAEWDGFYVIVGSAAGGLIGWQFVVMTLIAARPPPLAHEAAPAFATPTVVHFGTVLLLAAILRAPWPAITPVAALWGLVGVGGAAYSVIVTLRMRWQSAYRPEFEDWLFHAILPFMAYATLVITALTVISHAQYALFGVGAAALVLLFSGIHNAWDDVAYHMLVNLRRDKD